VHNVDMTTQLTLIESESGWKLDESTRNTGRRGIADARAIVAAARTSRGSKAITTTAASAGDGAQAA
jgi:hypothetical protein